MNNEDNEKIQMPKISW